MVVKKYKKYSELQKQILKRLLEGSIKQKDLAKEFNVTRSTVKYHIDRLEERNLIKKDKIVEVGAVKIFEIFVNPFSLHQIREILGLKVNGITLITGFGKLGTGYRIPDISLKLLLEEIEASEITKIICFTTQEALETRKVMEKQEKLISIKDLNIHSHNYEDYRRYGTPAFRDLEQTILNHIDDNEIFLDLTPLSKLLSFKLQEYSEKYNIPSFYIGQDVARNDFLIWFRR